MIKTSERGKDFIKSFESLHDGDLKLIGLQPKMDVSQIWTEGWGSLVLDEKGKKIIGKENRDKAYKFAKIHTVEDADRQLDEVLKSFEVVLDRKVTVDLSQNQHDALISHMYNTGGSETLFKLINRKETEARIRRWWEGTYITSMGKVWPGLVRRRKAEANMFFEPHNAR